METKLDIITDNVDSRSLLVSQNELQLDEIIRVLQKHGEIIEISRRRTDEKTGKSWRITFKSSVEAKFVYRQVRKSLSHYFSERLIQRKPFLPEPILRSRPGRIPELVNPISEINPRHTDDDRLFCRLPYSDPAKSREKQFLLHFMKFGKIEYHTIIDNPRKEPAFAILQFRTAADARVAYDRCDQKYHAVFAEPLKKNFSENKSFHAKCGELVRTRTYHLHRATCIMLSKLTADSRADNMAVNMFTKKLLVRSHICVPVDSRQNSSMTIKEPILEPTKEPKTEPIRKLVVADDDSSFEESINAVRELLEETSYGNKLS